MAENNRIEWTDATGRRGARYGRSNPNWRGGRVIASNGYVLVRVGVGHRLADVRGYAYEHRVVAEQMLGRGLVGSEEVHHRDGDKQNNTPANLEVVRRPEHRALHRKPGRPPLRAPGEPNQIRACACGCEATFQRYDSSGRERHFVSGHNATRNPLGQFEVKA